MHRRGKRAGVRSSTVIALVVLLGCLALAVALTTPWQPSGDHAVRSATQLPLTQLTVGDDFTAAERASSEGFHHLVRLPAYVTSVVGVLAAALLGFTKLGSRLAAGVLPGVRRWWVRVLVGALVVMAVARTAAVPFDVWLERSRRDHGVSTQSWSAWAVDVVVGFAVGYAAAAVLLVVLVAVARRFPRGWWAPAAGVAAATLVLGSYVYPVLVEPLYNRFTPMAAGPLRASLLELAARDDVPVSDVLVADASRRTTRLNAYVSGFGNTRRIVVYDTLLLGASYDQVRHIVAHELGHAKRNDVLRGTLVGALAVGTSVVALALLLESGWLTRRAGVRSGADPRVVALVLALVAVGTLAAAPVQNLVSRRVETRADVHALDLTRDPAGYASTQHWLAVTNRSELEPTPLVFGLFATHPTAPERIALVRWWAARRGAPPVPALASR